ncbi:hypothetical protein F2Q68_00030032 [Brassica cretica]|uniref:NPK1-activating kinesin-like protein C-terminal domain-containing protein n=1 Tax=Brassica cretica TaxID=69181 RepID=A0A8S9G6B8_BRACR|nr:hypothetical protein F2Q68_00030032 [Brassica cretica]
MAVAAGARGRFTFNTSNNASFDLDNTVSTDAQSTKDSDTETSGGSFHEFMAGLKQMAMQHHSRHESDTETEKTKPERDTKAETYFFLLFKGDPSNFVYMEVELRRLSFLKDSPEMVRKQSAKTLGREREWLAKQIPKKFGGKDREEVYKKWGTVELSSKQRSMQVTHKAWTKIKDVDHCKESASLVATLVGFDESNTMPKEMFGLSFSPTTTLNKITSMINKIILTRIRALALRSGVIAAVELEINGIKIFSDNTTLIRAIKFDTQAKELFGIISDIQKIVLSSSISRSDL